MTRVLSILLLFFILMKPMSGVAEDKSTTSGYPTEIEIRLREAEDAYQKKEWQKSVELYARLVEERPELLPAHVGLAISAVKLAEYPRAIAAFQRALELQPETPGLQGELADAYRLSGQFHEAEKWYRRAIETAKENASVSWYIGLGLLETSRGDYEKARQYYISAVLYDPDATIAYQNLGVVLLEQNRLDEADAAFQMVLEQDDTMAAAFYGRGQVAAKRRDLNAARRFYSRAVALDPDNASFHYAHAQTLFRLGAQEEGQEALTRYRRAKAQVYLREAYQLRKKQQWKEALAQLQKSVEADPTFTEAILERAYVQMRLGEFDSAKKTCIQILHDNPDTPRAHYYLGIIEAKQDNLDAAESAFLEVIRLSPDFPDSYPQLAQIR